MTKRQYLKKLRRALRGVGEYERERCIDYYAELIDESYERGKTSHEIFSELASPEEAAQAYLRDREGGYTPPVTPPRAQKKESAIGTVLLPARIVLGIALSILAIVVLAVVVALFAAGIAVGVSGVFIFAMSFGPLFHGYAGVAFAQFGAAIALTGVSGLLFVVARLVWKLNAFLWRLVTMQERRKPSRKGIWGTVAVSSAIVVLGSIVFLASFGSLGFERSRLAVTGDVITHDLTVTEEVTDLSLESDNLAITVKRSEDDTLRIVYRDLEGFRKSYSFENGTMTLTETEENRVFVFGAPIHLQWQRGVWFGAASQDLHRAELYLPESFAGTLSVKVKNGTISIADASFAALSLETENGVIQVKNVSAESLHATTVNGVISLEYVSVRKLNATTNNGAVNIDRLRADDIELYTNNGAIKGTIIGSEGEYAIEASTRNGSCNLRNKSDGDKHLKANTNNGAIKIKFVSS